MHMRWLFIAALAGVAGIGLILSERNYWVVAITMVFLAPTTLASWAVFLAKKGVTPEASAKHEGKIVSYYYFGVTATLLFLTHILLLPIHLTTKENLGVLAAHLFAMVFSYFIAQVLFMHMYSSTIQRANEKST